MSKGMLERGADLVHAAKALRAILRALKGGWQAAALALLRHYWPQILTIALILALFPVIMICCLPAIFLGFGGSREQDRIETYRDCYDKYEEYRAEQLEEICDEQEETCSIEYLNDPLDRNWLIALDSVNNGNDIDQMDEEKLKELIKNTYTYEIVDAEPKESREPENPWEDTTHSATDSDTSSKPSKPSKVIKVTTQAPEDIMRELGFDDEHMNWATLIYDTLKNNLDNG